MRKASSHKTVIVHFHDDGEVCPQSFGVACPHGGVEGPMDPADPSFLSKLPNGFNLPNLSTLNSYGAAAAAAAAGVPPGAGGYPSSVPPGVGGYPSSVPPGVGGYPSSAYAAGAYSTGAYSTGAYSTGAYSAASSSSAGGAGFSSYPDFTYTDYSYDGGGGSSGPNQMVSTPGIFSSSTSNNYFDSGFMSDLTASLDIDEDLSQEVAPNSLVIADGNSQNNQNIANMAKMAITSGTPTAVAAMAKVAAASGNVTAAKAMAQMAQVAAQSGVKSIPPQALMSIMAKTGLGGSAGVTAAMAAVRKAEANNVNNVDKQLDAQKYAAVMQKQAANVQMSKALAGSSIAKMSNAEVRIMTDGKFSSTKEFVDYMQSPDTDVSVNEKSTVLIR